MNKYEINQNTFLKGEYLAQQGVIIEEEAVQDLRVRFSNELKQLIEKNDRAFPIALLKKGSFEFSSYIIFDELYANRVLSKDCELLWETIKMQHTELFLKKIITGRKNKILVKRIAIEGVSDSTAKLLLLFDQKH